MDFDSCVILGKLLELSESVFSLQNGENNSTFFMGVLAQCSPLSKSWPSAHNCPFLPLCFVFTPFCKPSFFPIGPWTPLTPKPEQRVFSPGSVSPGNQLTQPDLLLSDPTGLSPCLPRLPSEDFAYLCLPLLPFFFLIWRCSQALRSQRSL